MNKSQRAKVRRGHASKPAPKSNARTVLVDALVAELDTIPVSDVRYTPPIMPKAATGLDAAFGPSRINDWLPARKDIPESFL
jgi:hypothetical protein